jgi:hypothetical protein
VVSGMRQFLNVLRDGISLLIEWRVMDDPVY